jgi:signal peptidase
MPKAVRVIQNITLGLLALVGAVSLVIVAVTMLTTFKPVAIVSGSMAPTINPGTMVMTELVPAIEIKPGDIVTVDRPDVGYVTHRVVTNTPIGDGQFELQLKGDANSAQDDTTYQVALVSRYLFQVPFIGYGIQLIQTQPFLMAALVLALLILAMWGRGTVDVHMPDGTVIKNISKGAAKRLTAQYQALQEIALEEEPVGAGTAYTPRRSV